MRRAQRRLVGTGMAVGAILMVALGGLDARMHARYDTACWLGFGLLMAWLVALLAGRLGYSAPTAMAQRASRLVRLEPELVDLQLALVVAAATYAVLAESGQLYSPLYPVLYAMVAFAATLLTSASVVALLGAVTLLEAAAGVRLGYRATEWLAALWHVGLVAGFAVMHAFMFRGLVRRYRVRRTEGLARELERYASTARDYRLIAVALGPASRAARPRQEEERLLAMGGVQMIGDTAHWVLTTIKRSAEARTVALLWLDDEPRLYLREIVSELEAIVEGPRLASSGVLGAVLRDRAPLLCTSTKPGQLPYYARDPGGQAVVAVPVMEQGQLRGVLCADRAHAFTPAERDLFVDAAAQLMRTVQAEQVFRAVERAKYEHERFYAASALLGQALTPAQVMATAFDATQQIVEYDFGAITLLDAPGRHRVAQVWARPGADIDEQGLTDYAFRDNAGLVSMVLKNRHYLPASGELPDATVPIFDGALALPPVKSAVVLPLLAGEHGLGTLVLLATRERRFGKDIREMLSVIANHVAMALQNGLLYQRMETMATTDGLTGLTNHRTFQERFAEMLERADRHGTCVAMLLCDVDHFKRVNDTYGHPIGDEVLRRVAKVLQDVPRKIDVPARYGGEEFAVLLDNVDAAQARAVAERIRTEVSKQVVETEKGPLRVTQSIGIALFPLDGRDRATLIEHADNALYHAKHTGRNRVVTYGDFQTETRERATPAEIAQKAS